MHTQKNFKGFGTKTPSTCLFHLTSLNFKASHLSTFNFEVFSIDPFDVTSPLMGNDQNSHFKHNPKISISSVCMAWTLVLFPPLNNNPHCSNIHYHCHWLLHLYLHFGGSIRHWKLCPLLDGKPYNVSRLVYWRCQPTLWRDSLQSCPTGRFSDGRIIVDFNSPNY